MEYVPVVTEIETEEGWDEESRTLGEICEDINRQLKELGLEPGEYGFDPMSSQVVHAHDVLFPLPYRWIAVYYVRGGSEGWYIHIDVTHENKRELVALAKTWERQNAEDIVLAVSKMLDV